MNRRPDITGTVKRVDYPHPALDRDDECSECGERLSEAGEAWLADCGRYCSPLCLDGHVDFLARCEKTAGAR